MNNFLIYVKHFDTFVFDRELEKVVKVPSGNSWVS